MFLCLFTVILTVPGFPLLCPMLLYLFAYLLEFLLEVLDLFLPGASLDLSLERPCFLFVLYQSLKSLWSPLVCCSILCSLLASAVWAVPPCEFCGAVGVLALILPSCPCPLYCARLHLYFSNVHCSAEAAQFPYSLFSSLCTHLPSW